MTIRMVCSCKCASSHGDSVLAVRRLVDGVVALRLGGRVAVGEKSEAKRVASGMVGSWLGDALFQL